MQNARQCTRPTVRLPPISTSCKWHRTHWPGWFVKHRVLSAPWSYATDKLHWFPISQQITYKVVRCHVCLNGLFICRMEINMINRRIAFDGFCVSCRFLSLVRDYCIITAAPSAKCKLVSMVYLHCMATPLATDKLADRKTDAHQHRLKPFSHNVQWRLDKTTKL